MRNEGGEEEKKREENKKEAVSGGWNVADFECADECLAL